MERIIEQETEYQNGHWDIFRGLHPGRVVERELKKRLIPVERFADAINESLQTLDDIIQGRMAMNIPLSLKIEKELGYVEGALMTLQVYYDIREFKKIEDSEYKPDLSCFRRVVFWDTDINTIDWRKYKRAVIERVFERGNKTEQNEIIRFYGPDEVKRYLPNINNTVTSE